MSSIEHRGLDLASIGTWAHLDGGDSHPDLVNVVIEAPRDSRCKYKFDEKQGLFLLHKLLPLGSSFPYDFGFIQETEGEDGDPLDVLLLLDEPVITGCVVPVRLIGVLEAEQTESGKTVRNDRLIGVVETLVNPAEPTSLDEIGEQALREIEHFFVSYNEIEGRQFKCLGRQDAKQALALVQKGRDRAQRSGTKAKSNGKGQPEGAAHDGKAHDQQPEGEPAPAEGTDQAALAKVSQSKVGASALRPGKSFRKEISRIVHRQLDKALRDLCRLGATADEAIHNVRKRFKRVRAVLRLVRDELGNGVYHEENESLRDAAAAFSDVRNARVLVDAVEKLRHRESEIPVSGFEAIERFLKARQRDIHDRLARNVEAMDELREAIENGRARADSWRLPRDGRQAIRRGLRRSWKAGARALEEAEKNTTSENLHECRKQAKYLYHQVQMLESVASPTLVKLEEQLHTLEQKLGDDHDLGMLRVEAAACLAGGLRDVDERLLTLIDDWRKELQAECLELAREIYREDSATLPHQFREWSKQLA
jgi:inorganic pyrophosphatase